MKKLYIIPETEVIEFETTGMLCFSGNIGGNATDPAHAPEMDDDMEDY